MPARFPPAIWLTISPASLPTIACSGNAARSVAIIAFSASVSALHDDVGVILRVRRPALQVARDVDEHRGGAAGGVNRDGEYGIFVHAVDDDARVCSATVCDASRVRRHCSAAQRAVH